MSDAATLPDEAPEASSVVVSRSLVLTVVWAPTEGHLLGSSLVPIRGQFASFGRGDVSGEGMPRLKLVRLRPAGQERLEVSNGKLSRHQFRILRESEGGLQIENVGLCPMLLDGREARSCEVEPGDVVVLGHQMAFLCHSRALRLAATRSLHPFGEPDGDGIVGESESAWGLRRDIDFAANRGEHVLVLGPSGSGKELVASAIHKNSARGSATLVSRNAATIPETLIDAELFGNAKNYPNPGMPERLGLVGQAHLSTLLLDEFAELPVAMQAHLLRVLDSGEFQRLGEAAVRRSDFRLIGATNRPISALKEDVAARFVHRLRVPDLNERREDIPLIVRHLLRQIGLQDRAVVQRFFPGGDLGAEPQLGRELLVELVSRTYRTHVRELRSILWESIRQSQGSLLELPLRLATIPSAAPLPGGDAGVPSMEDEGVSLSAERVQRVLDENNGSIERSWKVLGLSSRYVLRRLISKLGLEIRKTPSKRP